MKFAIALHGAPHAPSSRRALRFAQAVLAAGHRIERIFLYQDAVYLASSLGVTARDEYDVAADWQAFVTQHQIDAVVCIAAALRRGVLDAAEAQRHERSAANLAAGWSLAGLGQWHEAVQLADRLVCFGGD
ncbi:sulfurtransferase complex subunit TusD [Pseudomonas sp. NW5]|uniref:sulfurtransferase complex subunit TusD n=1 Tax=Pseudomonas sp. NW5 TaxID=2934934 RepID=UPI002020652B|nr:sulfurtransferase complex subunit TusD [Pseudomonas sp. NW5]MCL7463346.1 sulfurtransferase complex subunit TusD [Pseudomonas sp. NW5]